MRLIVIAGIIAFPDQLSRHELLVARLRLSHPNPDLVVWWEYSSPFTSMVLGTIREQVCKAANENPSEVIKSQ